MRPVVIQAFFCLVCNDNMVMVTDSQRTILPSVHLALQRTTAVFIFAISFIVLQHKNSPVHYRIGLF